MSSLVTKQPKVVAMINCLCLKVRFCSDLDVVKISKGYFFFINSDSCPPFCLRLVPSYTDALGPITLVGAAAVVGILVVINNLQICNSVVVTHPVNVINLTIGPRPITPEPR